MPAKNLSYDMKSMMHGLSEVRAEFFQEILLWKLAYKYLFNIDIDVFTAPISGKPLQGEWRLVAVYKLSPAVLTEALDKMFPGCVKFSQKMFIDIWSKRDFAMPLHFVWVPDRLSLSTAHDNYYWTLEECLADELMYQFEKRLSGDFGMVNPSLLSDIHKATLCNDTMLKDVTRPAVYRDSDSGNYHIEPRQPTLLPAETHCKLG